MKILLLDIETAPNQVHVWGLYDQNIAINQITASGYVLCWTAKWYDKSGIYFRSVRGPNKAAGMLKEIHKLLDEADVVVHYNGRKFDIPTLNKEFIIHGLRPPSPYKQVDLYHVVRRVFKFPSNKLDYVCQVLGLGKKVRHPGHEMWVDCMDGDEAAWKKMRRYNQQDVKLLEGLYKRLLPWVPNHPNHGAYDGRTSCPSCGGTRLQSRGTAVTRDSMYTRYQCLGCGAWSRSKHREKDRTKTTLQGVSV